MSLKAIIKEIHHFTVCMGVEFISGDKINKVIIFYIH